MTSFIDAGGWISVVIRTDQHHQAGRAYFEALIGLGARAVTSDFVLDEVITRLRYDVGHAAASEFLGLIRRAEEAGILEIRRIDKPSGSRLKRSSCVTRMSGSRSPIVRASPCSAPNLSTRSSASTATSGSWAMSSSPSPYPVSHKTVSTSSAIAPTSGS